MTGKQRKIMTVSSYETVSVGIGRRTQYTFFALMHCCAKLFSSAKMFIPVLSFSICVVVQACDFVRKLRPESLWVFANKNGQKDFC